MGLRERVVDSINALAFKINSDISIHAAGELVGRVIGTDVPRGQVRIKPNNGDEITLPGHMVADLDTPL